ncbi:NAD(P)/FAD-dependent oxidoreductase [Arthrobacter sp. zg-Y895]|uniref:NAD(P)/FAD-dependent oxidoreductase n=1 Tax=Arthrobacter sp. zg-Y895 TaxID=2886933 RepID=UPI001D138735|nr:NAD(P)/FAD-dependent oxidoreductase [Arthrobacter sp. zg-Y895]MCC3301618.1 NAD(P)/FAD-dependent oxidoreductase [Arthrobacter sp. zg-Y895]
MATGEYDVVVVGGAAAGLSGALILARARRSVAVVDAADPRNSPAAHVHNHLGLEGAPPSEFTAAGRAEIAGYGAVVLDGSVSTVTRSDGGRFLVSLADGESLLARRVLAASGARDILPDIPGLAQYWGKDVLHCPYCHGWEVRDRQIGILAGDLETAVHQALMWRQWSEDIGLFLHTAGEPDSAQAEELAARGIRVVAGKVTAVEGDSRLTGLRLASGEVVQRQAVVIVAPVHARAGYLADLGIEPVEQFVGERLAGTAVPAAEPTGATTVPGVYAAGNIVVPSMQVTGAAAAGLAAGAAVNADLIAEETERAVAAARAGRSGG